MLIPKIVVCGLIGVLSLTACATAPKATLNVTKPDPSIVTNERFYDLPFDDVWQRLVEDLSKSFFVINNISKESNLINVSFATDDPEGYLDCGTSTRTYQGETYTYPIAASSSYKTAQQANANAFYVYSINRDTKLEGRINIYVAPEGQGTKVSVNVKYILSITSTGSAEAIAGVLQISQGYQTIPEKTSTVTFNTNEQDQTGEVVCFSTGRLENTILDMVLN